MIQHAVDVSGVDQEFCIATDSVDDEGVAAGEVLPSPASNRVSISLASLYQEFNSTLDRFTNTKLFLFIFKTV